MIKLGIFQPELAQVSLIIEYIDAFVKQHGTSIKWEKIKTITDLESDKALDACFIDFNTYRNLRDRIHITDRRLPFILVAKNTELVIEAMETFPGMLYLQQPLQQLPFNKVVHRIYDDIRERAIIVKKGHDDDFRIYLKDLNYVNIDRRNILFHVHGEQKTILGPIIRRSFKTEMETHLGVHPELFLASPGIVINLGNVISISMNKIIFSNKDMLFFPKSSYTKLKEAWRSYYLR